MSPATCILAIILIEILYVCYVKRWEDKRKSDRISKLCYHTMLDCENCVSYKDCKYKNDPEAIINVKEED